MEVLKNCTFMILISSFLTVVVSSHKQVNLNTYQKRVKIRMDSFTNVPPGFRFHPTDEELVDYYLRKKVASKRIEIDFIKDIDLYKIEPWDLLGLTWKNLSSIFSVACFDRFIYGKA